MKILVLGATGRTGLRIIEQAQQREHEVVTIARDPSRLEEHNIEVIEGSPYDYETVERAMKGVDAVINTLNVSRKTDNPWAPLRAPADLISRSASNAVIAMGKTGVKRFVALSTIGAGRSWKTSPAILKFVVSISNLKHAFKDHGRQEEVLEGSDLDYTVCRAPMLSDDPIDSEVIATPEGERPASRVLSRRSAAKFFLDIIEQGDLLRKTVSIANGPVADKK